MGNYIYSYISPKAYNVKLVMEDIKNDIHEKNKIAIDPISNIKEKEDEDEEKEKEKLIHPYLLEYGTNVYNICIINNNVYKYTKNN